MACVPFKDENGFGFMCSDIGFEKDYELEFIKNNKEKIKQYKYEFIRAMKDYTQCPTWICYQEVMAHIENIGVLELNYCDPTDDMQECVSCWNY